MAATPNMIWNKPSDRMVSNATITVQTGTAEDGYDPEDCADLNPAMPLRLVENLGAILFAYASAVSIPFWALFHCNFLAGLDVRVQAKAVNASWGSPDFEKAFTIPTWFPDLPGPFPGQPWLDLTNEAGYAAFQYWRIAVLGDNTVPLSFGEIWPGGAVRRLDPNIDWTAKESIDKPNIKHSTAYRDLVKDLGTTRRMKEGMLDWFDDQVDDILNWHREAGSAYAFPIVPDGRVNEAWLVRATTTARELEQNFVDRNVFRLGFKEEGRGLYPTPSPY